MFAKCFHEGLQVSEKFSRYPERLLRLFGKVEGEVR
jgi:hypothetical protein